MAHLAQRRSVDVPLDPVTTLRERRFGKDDAPFWKSIRFRLAAWYALVMFLVILGISMALHTLLERTLEMDAQQRLETTSREVARSTHMDMYGYLGPTQDSQRQLEIDITLPDESSLILSGLWFQYYDMYQEPYIAEGTGRDAFTSALDEALSDRSIFRTDDRPEMRTVTVAGEEMLVYVSPLTIEADGEPLLTETPPGWLVVGEPLGAREKLTSLVDRSLLIFGFAGVVLAAWGGWLIAGRGLAPVEEITASANAIAVGTGGVNFSRRVDVPETGDELHRLATTFNAMLDRIEDAFRTQQRFVADASHELRSPLTAVRGNVDVLLRQLTSGRPVPTEHIVEDLQVVQRESGRMSRLIEDLLTLARTDVASLGELLKPEAILLDQLAREAFQIARQLATGQNMRLDVQEPVELVADKDRLVQVMIILLENAIRHTPADGSITLKVDRVVDRESLASCARIMVIDTGSGIDAEHIPHLFERFYRVEKARSRHLGGTGLGLSIALAVARAHSGWIDVDSEPGTGTTFTVWLPLANGFSGRDAVAESSSRIRRRLRLSRPGRPKLSPQVDPRTVAKPERAESNIPLAEVSRAEHKAQTHGREIKNQAGT